MGFVVRLRFFSSMYKADFRGSYSSNGSLRVTSMTWSCCCYRHIKEGSNAVMHFNFGDGDLVQECVRGVLKDKTVILVTHQVDFLHNADLIMV